ncbi:MAG TPA: hypothetical protein VJT68_03730 [Thermoleophilaceae bacterium]|nr:hypothetical protein [Thermoleophilaceae bacterium]
MLLAVAGVALAMSAPAHADAPISAHAMVHTCCTPAGEKERIFSEAEDLGTGYVRVDVELSGIFKAPGAEPDWGGLDQVIDLSKEHHVRVLGILLGSPDWADDDDYGRLSGLVAEHAGGAIDHWEIWNEPDGDWSFDGTPEDYARMLSAAHDRIKAKAPADQVVLGGLARPHEPDWLQRVFDTPGADALHKFDIANVHLRGSVDAVVRRYETFGSWLAERGFHGPLWVTELGYPADPAFQTDPAYSAGDASQAAYLTQVLVGLGEVGAPEVFVTLRDNPALEGKYVTEGLSQIDETPGGDYPVTRRPSFTAVHRVIEDWDQLLAWREEQREQEKEQFLDQAKAALWRTDARTARDKFREARLSLHAAQSSGVAQRVSRARALLAGARTALLLKGAIANWHVQRASDHAAAVALLKTAIAGG